jgi:ADP-ribose pyrophosphatase YjhB (NUDIX family)
VKHFAGAILVREGRVLLGRRAPHRKRAPNSWDIIGGVVEAGETADRALVREVLEEIAVVPTWFERVAVLGEPEPDLYGEGAYHIYRVREWRGGEPTMRGEEHVELRWFTPEEACAMPDLAWDEYRRLFRAIVGSMT